MLGLYLSKPAAYIFGNLYPCYMTYRTIVSKKQADYKQWLMFWTVNTVFTILEMFGDAFVSWLPLYYEAKIAALIWLALPRFKGAETIYENYVGPVLDEYESHIDDKLDAVQTKAWEKFGELRVSLFAFVQSKSTEILGAVTKMMAAAAEETRNRSQSVRAEDDGAAERKEADAKDE